MGDSGRENTNLGRVPDNNNSNPNPREPSGTPITHPDEDKNKEYEAKFKKEFRIFSKANDSFNSVDKELRVKDKYLLRHVVDEWVKYLPDSDKIEVLKIISREGKLFKLDKDD